jgi:hypothetical protein
VAADIGVQYEAEHPRGDALLEDELVDSPDGMHPASSYGLPDRAAAEFGGQPLPETVGFTDEQPQSTAEAVAYADDNAQSLPEAEAYDDGGQPLPESEIAALPEAPAPGSSRYVPPARVPPSGGVARGAAARRPGQERESVPTWAKSPDEPTARRGRRRLVWTIAASVLGASVVAGGLAGFFVGSRGKPLGAGGGRLPALSRPKAVPAPAPAVPDEVEPQTSQPSGSEAAAAKMPETGTRRVVPAVQETASAAKKSGSEKPLAPAPTDKPLAPTAANKPSAPTATQKPLAPTATEKPLAPTAAKPSPGLPAAAPSAAPPSPAGQKTAPPTPPDKKAIAAASTAPATWGKGVPDGAGAGSLATLSVTSQPVGADVWINGKERGRTPLQVRVQPGPARVVLVLPGHASATVDVTAREEGAQISKELVAVAPPLTGEARFRAECITQGKLPIVVDGKETGILCPFTKLRVDPGVHKIGVFVPALGKVHEKEVTLQPGVRSIVFGD